MLKYITLSTTRCCCEHDTGVLADKLVEGYRVLVYEDVSLVKYHEVVRAMREVHGLVILDAVPTTICKSPDAAKGLFVSLEEVLVWDDEVNFSSPAF